MDPATNPEFEVSFWTAIDKFMVLDWLRPTRLISEIYLTVVKSVCYFNLKCLPHEVAILVSCPFCIGQCPESPTPLRFEIQATWQHVWFILVSTPLKNGYTPEN